MTGLSTHVIRVWEKRYGAVRPERSGTNRRLYSSEDIERLTLLRLATNAGHSISNVAGLSLTDLRTLVGQELPQSSSRTSPSLLGHAKDSSHRTEREAAQQAEVRFTEALEAVRRLDGDGLDRVLSQASLELSQTALIQTLVVPLIHRIGQLWESGHLKIAHEHVASASIRTFLGHFMRQHSTTGYAPSVVVTTPSGQIHELGAILAAAEANNHGWKVCYLGPSLPAEEIAAAAIQNRSLAVALSIVYPADDPRLGEELQRLRQLLPADTAILLGGRAAAPYLANQPALNLIHCADIADFGAKLKSLRKLK